MRLQHGTDQQAPFESLAHASEWSLNETAISLMGMKFRIDDGRDRQAQGGTNAKPRAPPCLANIKYERAPRLSKGQYVGFGSDSASVDRSAKDRFWP
jgi:hypothetical protein